MQYLVLLIAKITQNLWEEFFSFPEMIIYFIFYKGCKTVKTCDQTEHGCCPDDVTPADGPRFLGCLDDAICSHSLFGCCADNYTEASGPSNEGCEDLIEFHCKESRLIVVILYKLSAY